MDAEVFMLTDAEIARLTPAQRRRLIRKLTRSLEEVAGPPARIERMQRLRVTFMAGSVLVLIPWIVYLGLTLPNRHVTTHWTFTWVGFDVMLLIAFAITAALGLLRRQLLVLSAFATALLLVCDAWFDLTTAGARGWTLSLISAVVVELPVAVFLLNTALRLLRIQAQRMWLMPPARHLWEVPLLLEDSRGDGVDGREDGLDGLGEADGRADGAPGKAAVSGEGVAPG
jgi:hypothetical protein